ncbi:MAG: AAC(3) family N-acetyltransferase [Clostridia bacterium]
MHTRESLQMDLEKMGLKPTDAVLVHSSMRAIGAVEGRADTVLDALMDFFSLGLLALPTLTWGIEHNNPPVFDVRRTLPAVGVGILPMLFFTRPHVERSLHPTHSMAAIGADAKALVAEDHLNHTPCGSCSSWYKLLERDAHILMVGCDLTSCTFIHGVEEWNHVPGRLKPPMDFTMIRQDSTSFTLSSSPHLGSPSEQYGRAQDALREGGALADGQFGSAPVLHLSAKRTFEIVSAMLRQNPELFS